MGTTANLGSCLGVGDPTRQLLREIADRTLHQVDVAQMMALVLQCGQRDEVDWAAVAAAAIARWSRPGWRRIKALAWSGKCWDAAPAPPRERTVGGFLRALAPLAGDAE